VTNHDVSRRRYKSSTKRDFLATPASWYEIDTQAVVIEQSLFIESVDSAAVGFNAASSRGVEPSSELFDDREQLDHLEVAGRGLAIWSAFAGQLGV